MAADGLPRAVLQAVGFVTDPQMPASRRTGGTGAVTDTDIVDAIALGLGTKAEWNGADELEWIAETVAKVRPHPGNASAPQYLQVFTDIRAYDPTGDGFLCQYVDDEVDN